MSGEDVAARAKKFEKIFEEFSNSNLPGVTSASDLAKKFKDEGATVAESQDYVKLAQQRLSASAKEGEREKSPSGNDGGDSGTSGSGKTGDELSADELRKRTEASRKAFEEAEWAKCLQTFNDASSSVPSSSEVDIFLSTVLPRTSLFSLPPGLAGDHGDLEKLINPDPHIGQTLAITQHFVQDKSELELMLLRARSFQLVDPVPHSIWKEVILDRYVNFDKLNHTLQPGYNQSDEPKLELGDLVISDKSRISSKKPVTTVSDWGRVFGAGAEAVTIIYPHRKTELRAYHFLMSTFFRNHPGNPLVGIHLDDRIRESYLRCPFRLNDRAKFSEHTIAQHSASLDVSKRKEAPTGVASLPKRPSGPVCLNWNGNRCKDPCPANRRHGLCSQL
ncbi:hypothetical protein AAF712_015833 [Marasmius tenuissimus]|uniref:Uncharacterized protein n=1 Tax=Marasmius tenuissimus TaxID=585030 RepID=A0ABR2ZAM5_9AGAR